MRAFVLILAASAAHADTLGYPPCTAVDGSWSVARPSGGAHTFVARDTASWRAAWKAAGGAGDAPAVDFERDIVVGVIGKGPIYRVQLDDAGAARTLEVRTGYPDAPCRQARTPVEAGAHFVAVARSALAVHFTYDQLIDGHAFTADNEGVAVTDLGTVAAPPPPATAAKAPHREDAERAVVAALSAAELAKLRIGPLDRPMKRAPHAWTRLAVSRTATTWHVGYDDLAFEVDVATGKVRRK